MCSAKSDQQSVWAYFQNEGVVSFVGCRGRQEFLVRRLRAGVKVLNIGVGNACFERLAANKGVDVWTLDPDEQAILKLQQFHKSAERAKVGVCQEMPFPDSFFDFVVMSEVLEHLDDFSFHQTLSEVKRVLVEKGRFIGTVPARENLIDSITVCPKCGDVFHRWGHKQSFDVCSLSVELEKYFLIKNISEYFFIEWNSVNLLKKMMGVFKKILSRYNIGVYGKGRNIFFDVQK